MTTWPSPARPSRTCATCSTFLGLQGAVPAGRRQPAVRRDSAEPAARRWRRRLYRYRYLVEEGHRGGSSLWHRECRGQRQGVRLLRHSGSERVDADQGRGLCALRLQRDHRRPRVRLDSRDRRRAAGHRHVLRYPLAPARRVPLRPDLCRGAEEHRPVRPGGGDRSRRPARPRPQRLPDHAQLQDRRGQRFHVQHPGDLLLVPVRPGLRMAEGAGRGDRDGAAQPRQEGPAVQDHRCQRLLHQPDPAERPLLDERAVPPGRRASRQAVPGGRRGARAAQPERPPLGRRHARFHLQRPWPDAVEALVAYMAEFEKEHG